MLVFISSRIIIHSAEDYVYPLMDIELFSDILEELKINLVRAKILETD